jgi:hypothetical protein
MKPNNFEPGKFYEYLCTTKRIVEEGRPERKTVISKDEILDLTILLHTCQSVEEFVKSI